MCEHLEGHVIINHSKCFSSKCASMMVRSFTVIQGYHYSLTIDSVRVPLTDVQGLIAYSISARTNTTSDKAMSISWGLAT